MNGYERVIAALEGRMPDRRPVMLHNFMVAAREAGYTMKQYREDSRIAVECHLRFVEKYDTDGILFDVDTALTAGACGVPVDFPEDEPARTHDPLLKSLSDEELWQLETVRLIDNPRIQHSLEAVRLLKEAVGNDLFIRGNCDQAAFSLACSLRTPGVFMMDLMMDEDRAVRLLELCAAITVQYIELMSQTGADMVSNGDSPAGPSMISPDMYVRYAMPYEKMLVDSAHKSGLYYILHICGNADLILENMASLSLDGVDLDYLTPVQRIHDVMGEQVTLCGTVDPSGVLAFGTPDQVKEKVQELVRLYEGNPRLILNAGCALPPFTPEANIRAFIEAARE